MPRASDLEVAWAAGLFEGEGCISIKHPQPRRSMPSICLVIQMTDEDVLARFREAVACGRVYLRRAALMQKKAVYSWEVGNRTDVERVLAAFMPWLGARRAAKAQIALDVCASMDRECLGCGRPFRARRFDAYWCSHKHKASWHGRQRRAAESFIQAVV